MACIIRNKKWKAHVGRTPHWRNDNKNTKLCMRTADVNVLRVETGSLLLLQMDADELLMRFMAVRSYVDLTQTNKHSAEASVN